MKRTYNGLLIILICAFFLAGISPLGTRAAPQPDQPPVDQAIDQAVQAAIQENRLAILGLLLYQTEVYRIDHSNDGRTALVWLRQFDLETGEIVETEPGLTVVRNLNDGNTALPSSWTVSLPNAADWATVIANLPQELVTDDINQIYLPQAQQLIQPAATSPFTGYRLPWVAGLQKRVTNSIGHVYTVSGGLTSCPTTCRYAYDFADGTMFPLVAAKGGTVKAWKTTCQNNDNNCTNYFVLEDQSTSPVSYQLYYHMMYDSLPANLRQVGVQVLRGQFIGNADNTGPSTGSHLHYHVYTSVTGTNWSWGPSVDFMFEDVSDNGGYPRTCAEASEYPNLGSQCQPYNLYTSGNTPANLPSGSLSAPTNRQVVETANLRIAGKATDDIGIERIQVLVNWDGAWRSLGDLSKPNASGDFSQDLNLCTLGIPDGPFSLMVKIFDHEGSQILAQPGVLQLIKNYYCGQTTPPAPACAPSVDQVALYTQPNFLGDCRKLDVGNYTSLSPVGDNAVVSVQVGSNVQAVLYDLAADLPLSHPVGRIETLETSDVNLADNRIGSGRVSGVVVQSRSTAPDEPFPQAPGARWDKTGLTNSDSLVLSWEGGAGDTSFEVTLKGPTANDSQTWSGLTGTSLSVGTRAAGNYTWTIKGINSAGTNTSNEALPNSSFSIANTPLSDVNGPRALPYNDDMENGANGWVANGLWRNAAVTIGDRAETHAWIYNNGANYQSTDWRAGDLTSPPLAIPAAAQGAYYLRFKYYMGVENANRDWDQRRVQVLTESGDYLGELYQFSDDLQPTGQWWIQSPPLSLAAYAGLNIRLRFHFNSIDTYYNSGLGWMIDDVSVNNQGPDTACTTDSDQNSPAQATQISIGATLQAGLCPQGDVDYYKFSGAAGQPIRVDIDAQTLSPASWLDSQVYLLDADGRSVVAENDDEELGVKTDSLLTFTLRRTGTYYLKVKAWDSPGAGGANYPYVLHLNEAQSGRPQSIQLLSPTSKNNIPSSPFEIKVQAVDFDGGPVAQVEFYWHGPDWVNGNWVKLGTDTQSNDGWSLITFPLIYGPIWGSALYVQADGAAGASLGLTLWDLRPELSYIYLPQVQR